jgi:hypothetical protein
MIAEQPQRALIQRPGLTTEELFERTPIAFDAFPD